MSGDRIEGKVCLVTGATNGIGKEAARGLLRLGAHVTIVGRDAARTKAVADELRASTANEHVSFLVADLSLQSEIRRLAAEIRDKHPRLDVLLNNAGAIFTDREVTAEGHEMTLALNHLGSFLLTAELRPVLEATPGARIVNVASEASRRARIDFEDLESKRGYLGMRVYGQSKLANIMFTFELARRLEGTRVTANCLHPGVVTTGFGKNTPGLLNWAVRIAGPFMLRPAGGADTAVFLASSPEVAGVTGKYFIRRRARRPNPIALDPEGCRRLWEVTERLTAPS